MLFLGTYKHTIDEKNRLSLPAKIAAKFSDHIVYVSKGFEGCLELRSQEDFAKRTEQILAYSQNKKDSRLFARQILANTNEIEIDKANRILLPANLLELAKLEKDVVIIGLGNRLEIWDAKAYENYKEANDSTFEAVAERIDDENKF